MHELTFCLSSMPSNVVDRGGDLRLSSIYERVRFFDERMAREGSSMGELCTPKETTATVSRQMQTSSSRLARPLQHLENTNHEAFRGELRPPPRPISPKTSRVRSQPAPQVPSNIKKRRDIVTAPRHPRLKRARLARSSSGNQTEDAGRTAPTSLYRRISLTISLDWSTRDWAVAKITGHEETRYGCRYRVAWEDTWEPEDCLENADFKIEEYWDQYYECRSPTVAT